MTHITSKHNVAGHHRAAMSLLIQSEPITMTNHISMHSDQYVMFDHILSKHNIQHLSLFDVCNIHIIRVEQHIETQTN